MSRFTHERHKQPATLSRPRELVLVCAPLRSNVNLSRIVRMAGCCGIQRLISIGPARVDRRIARAAADVVAIESHRSLAPVLGKLRSDGYRLAGLEQTTNSRSLHEYRFARRTALVVGNERLGLTADALELLDEVVEIPVYGLPHSYNVATAVAMTLYEYCRQFPQG